jgi:hypothetical protein
VDLTSAQHYGFNAGFICLFCFFCAALVTYYVRATFLTASFFPQRKFSHTACFTAVFHNFQRNARRS